MKAKATPKGYHTLNPTLWVSDVDAAFRFYRAAFGATEDFRRELKERLVLAVIRIGDSRLMLSDRQNDSEHHPADAVVGSEIELKIYVDNVDEVFRKSIVHGAKEVTPVVDQYFGERSGSIKDPFGFLWRLSEFVVDLSHEEIERRMRNKASA